MTLQAFHGTKRTLSVNEERVEVKIPIGVREQARLRLKQKGNIQPGTGKRGDLFLIIEINPHPVWRLEDDLLKAELPVSFDELVLGSRIDVMTPDGKAQLVIPPRTSPGKNLRLRNKGWPLRNNQRGDLIFTLILELPNEGSSNEMELLKEMQRARPKDSRKAWLASARL